MLSNGVKIWLVTWHFITTSECFVGTERVIMLFRKCHSCRHACLSLKFKICLQLIRVLDCQSENMAILFPWSWKTGRRLIVWKQDAPSCQSSHLARTTFIWEEMTWFSHVIGQPLSSYESQQEWQIQAVSISFRKTMLKAHVHLT